MNRDRIAIRSVVVVGAAWLLAALMVTVAANAQDGGAPPRRQDPTVIPRSAASRAALDSKSATPDALKDLRVRYGAWEQGDLDTPLLAAEAAVWAWRWDEPALSDPSVPSVLRARALVQQGAWDRALEVLAQDPSPRATALKGLALASAGKLAESRAALEPLMAEPMPAVVRTHGQRELVLAKAEALEAWSMTGRVAPQLYEAVIEALGAARALDRTDWEAMLLEARILAARHNRADAWKALADALAQHPRLAEAWRMRGELSASALDQADAMAIADGIDAFSPACAAAALLRARTALMQDDADGAEPMVRQVLKAAPTQPDALAYLAAMHAVRFRPEAMEQALADADRAAPGSPHAPLEVGRMLSRRRQYEDAAVLLRRAWDRAPEWSEPPMELGLMDMQSGEDARALEALRAAVERDPFNVGATLSLRLLSDMAPWPVREGRHFTLRSQPGIDDAMADGMLAQLDAMHQEVCARLGHEPSRRTRIELMPDHEWFGVRLTGLPAIHTIAACTGPVIAMEVPREGSRKKHLGLFDWLDVVRHEYVHTVTLSQTRNRIPHWMTEAIAVDLQHKRRDYKDCQMLAAALEGGTLFDFDSILRAFVRPAKPTDRAQAYAQGHWWVEFIRETWGDEALRRMLALYAEGATESQVLAQVLEVSKEQYLQRFTPWARAQVKAWGLAPEPPADELLGKDRVDPLSDKELELLLRTHPDHPDLLELAVRRRTERGEGDAPQVIALLERYCRARPVDPFPHRKLAEVALMAGRDADAVPHLERLDAITDRESSYAIELARIARAAGDGARAGAHIERAVRINPFDPSLRELAAATQLEAGNLAAARVHVVALKILEPAREQHRRRLARLDELMANAR
jgi:tetratricopeptide (TPR) repeat protein